MASNQPPATSNYREDSAGVRIPPPLFYAAAVVGGWLLDGTVSLPIGFAPVRPILAWLLAASSVLLIASCYRLFFLNRTTILPDRPATALIIAGPYRFTRNPLYLALLLLSVAVALWLNTWWPILLLAPAVVIMERYVIAREEAYLRRRFGAEYDAYTKRVRRWI